MKKCLTTRGASVRKTHGQRTAIRTIAFAFAILTAFSAAEVNAQDIEIFSNDRIGFASGQSREIQQTITFPVFGSKDRLTFNWDILADDDPWDRAGSIHVILPTGKQVQLGKFITGFKGTTSHSQNISDLAPLLSGQTLTVEAHIDTWVADAWHINASIDVQPDVNRSKVDWATPIFSRDGGLGYHDSGDIEKSGGRFSIPHNTERIKLTYFASGHHHNQTGNSDEFNQRRHHLYVDDVEVWTGIPWRTDGPDFRSVNPTSGRTDGNHDGDYTDPYPIDRWSSDYPRSGWVPGDEVAPYEIDVTDYLTEDRRHSIKLLIEDVDINSFWRVSGYLSGSLVDLPALPGDFNLDNIVDAADYTVWRDQYNQVGPGLAADADLDGVVNYDDYAIWVEHYGETLNNQSTAIPEPTTLSLLVLLLALPTCRRKS